MKGMKWVFTLLGIKFYVASATNKNILEMAEKILKEVFTERGGLKHEKRKT